VSGQRKALIIANDEYQQGGCAICWRRGRTPRRWGGYLVMPRSAALPCRWCGTSLRMLLRSRSRICFSESRTDDVLVLHFSGHGLKSESGELFFAASNTRPNRLGSTAVAADFVHRCMRDARSRSVVLLLDCCYGGAFAQGVTARAAGDVNVLDSFPEGRLGGGRGWAAITASNAMEYAFEGDRLADDQHRRPSVFTSALVEGLATGDADRDEDGLVSLNELYDYVFDKVREQNPHQTPSRRVEMEGELYLARSRRRRIRPAPVPPDLQAAITDQNMYTRRGAVHELESRLASEDLPVAAGAHEALAELARTDIRYVADLATTALRQAAIRPEETELHFGEQQQGSDPPHRTVRLLGPPIARACSARASDDWIHVSETTEGLDISVDTIGTGTRHGRVDLNGPTGEAVIAITVELLPQAAPPSRPRRRGRPAHQDGTAPAVPAGQPEAGSAANGRLQPREAAARETAEHNGPATAEAAEPQTMPPHRDHVPAADESSAAPQPATPTAPPAARPPMAQPEVAGTQDTGGDRLARWARGDRRLLFAGSLAVASAVLTVVGLFPVYVSGGYLSRSVLSTTPGWKWFVVGTAALCLTAGVCTLIPRAGPLLGPGLLLAAATASITALSYNLGHFRRSFSYGLLDGGLRHGVGFWLQLAANLSLLLAAGIAGFALARRSEVRLVQRPRQEILPWVIVLLGVAGMLALVFQDLKLANLDVFLRAAPVEVTSICTTVWALVMPAWAAGAVPRRLGVALLAGWIWVGAAFCVYCYLFLGRWHVSRGPIIVFGLTLLALCAVTVPFARQRQAPPNA